MILKKHIRREFSRKSIITEAPRSTISFKFDKSLKKLLNNLLPDIGLGEIVDGRGFLLIT